MSKIDREQLRQLIKKNWWLLSILAAGLILLLPSSDRGGTRNGTAEFTSEEQRLSQVLSKIEGVGEVYVLLAEKPGREEGYSGAVVVCRGAAVPQVRLRVVETVSVFTALGSNRIVVQNLVS